MVILVFKKDGKVPLQLNILYPNNVGVSRLLGYGKHPTSRLLRKIESDDRNFYHEYVSFCRYKGKVLRGLVKRRKVEFCPVFRAVSEKMARGCDPSPNSDTYVVAAYAIRSVFSSPDSPGCMANRTSVSLPSFTVSQ